MKRVMGIIATVALVMVFGCGKAESPQEKYYKDTTTKMEEMQQKMDKLSSDYDAAVAEMRRKLDQKIAAGKMEYDAAVAGLKETQAEANKELADMKSATGEAWEKAKIKMDKMLDDMGTAYESIKAKLRE